MTSPAHAERPYDVILWGATGFTGKLVADAFARAATLSPQRWAIAGRNQAKLDAVRAELIALNPALDALDILIADANDEVALRELASKTRVICTTVGPYARYGERLVAACAAQGTHYCDLSGEIHWVRRMIDAYHAQAQATGAKIVHCCGFDSIPSDLGTLTLQRAAIARYGSPCHEVTFYLMRVSGGFSGGTVASMLSTMEIVAEDPSVRRILGDPYSITPAEQRPDVRQPPDVGPPAYDEVVAGWVGPFLMAPVNTRVVRRSNALLGDLYGRDFSYREVMRTGSGAAGMASAGAMTAGLGLLMGAMSVAPLRELLTRFVLPAPGEGPTPEQIAQGHFSARVVGRHRDSDAPLSAFVAGERDPGYGATATMLSESALCLAHQADLLPEGGGVLTPASAMGEVLTARLRAAGMTFAADV